MRCFWTFKSTCVLLALGTLVACNSDHPDSNNPASDKPVSGKPDPQALEAESTVNLSDPVADLPDVYRLRNEAKLQADRHTEEGYTEGAALYGQIVTRPGASWVDYLNQARCLVFTPQFAEAEVALQGARRLLGPSRSHAAIAYMDGLYRKRIGDYESAATRFSTAAQLSPGQIQVWYQKGFAEERTQLWPEARQSYERALEIDPKFRAAAYRLVIVLRQLQQKDEERAAFERFNAMSEEGQPDPEKCGLTMVSLVPAERSEVEPPPVDLSWHEVTADWMDGRGEPNASEWDVSELDVPQREALHLLPKGRAADLDNDGATDLVAVGTLNPDGNPQSADLRVLWGNALDSPPSLDSASSVVTELDGISSPGAFELYDLDHDGDLDLVGAFAVRSGPIEFSWIRNNGDRTFSVMTGLTRSSDALISLPKEVARGRAVFDVQDFDQGNDLDLVVAGGEVPIVLMNLRDGSFRPLAVSELGKQDWVQSGDLNNDGLPDLFAVRNSRGTNAGVGTDTDTDTGTNATTADNADTNTDPAASLSATWSVVLHSDQTGHLGEVHWQTPTQGSLNAEVRDIVLEDVDNDADLDAVLATSSGVIWLRNSRGTFTVVDQWLTDARIETVVALDLNRDGQVEVIASGPGGIHVLAAAQPSPYPSWVVRPTGGRDNRDGIGVVADQFAGKLYQTRMVKRQGGVRFGLGRASVGVLDGVRLRWPQGIVQPENREDFVFAEGSVPDSRAPEILVTQKEGLVASCPFLYARGPNGWTFLTDVVGIAPLDEWLPVGATPHFDPEEYVRIDGRALADSAGRVYLAVTEELRETTYLDRVELVSIEHDANFTLWLDESSKQGAYDPLRALVFSNKELKSAANVRFDDGTVATDRVAVLDRVYAHAYSTTLSQWSGWVDRYTIEMVAPAGTSAILLTGRIGWYDSTVSYALHQHGRTWGPLQLLRKKDGRVLVPDLGLPAGMDRTMVSLFSEPLAVETEVILSGHHRFLWDRVLFAPAPVVFLGDSSEAASMEAQPTRQAHQAQPVEPEVQQAGQAQSTQPEAQVLPLRRAELSYHGYSRMVGDRARHEQTYIFADASPDDAFAPAFGKATRYGDVRPLLTQHDDELVVLVAGDKVELEFEAPADLREGRARTYFLRISGWAKEGSYHNRTGRWIRPLPFRAMSTYPPPPEEQRQDSSYREYLQNYQTRETAPLHAGQQPS